ncbi:MAG: hypothetical protein EBR82_60905 [Caulobacteraceae bacterium]|nr:hypothetical protein [Caulobacteraceae bacterium]
MTANTPQSRKAKGRTLQKEVVKAILQVFPTLTERDVQSTSSGAPGVDIKLSEKAVELLPLALECKFTEAFSLWKAWGQAVSNSGRLNPVVVHRKARTKPVAIVDLDYLLSLHAECDKLARMVEKANG